MISTLQIIHISDLYTLMLKCKHNYIYIHILYANLIHNLVEQLYSIAVADPLEGKSGDGPPIQFGYSLPPLQQRNKREILGNILNFPPLAEYLDPPLLHSVLVFESYN